MAHFTNAAVSAASTILALIVMVVAAETPATKSFTAASLLIDNAALEHRLGAPQKLTGAADLQHNTWERFTWFTWPAPVEVVRSVSHWMRAQHEAVSQGGLVITVFLSARALRSGAYWDNVQRAMSEFRGGLRERVRLMFVEVQGGFPKRQSACRCDLNLSREDPADPASCWADHGVDVAMSRLLFSGKGTGASHSVVACAVFGANDVRQDRHARVQGRPQQECDFRYACHMANRRMAQTGAWF